MEENEQEKNESQEIPEVREPQTKLCPFCAEVIQGKAIKCRYCGEFLNSQRARSLIAGEGQGQERKRSNVILFKGRPSIWGLTGSVIKGAFFIAIAVFLIRYPLEDFLSEQAGSVQAVTDSEKLTGEERETIVEKIVERLPVEKEAIEAMLEERAEVFGEEQAELVKKYRKVAGAGIVILVGLVLLLKLFRLKMTCYEVTEDRIEWSRGILNRRVDNIDMFRVIDLKLRRSLLDCMLGIGTVELVTTDKTDPQFKFEKIRRARKLYDIIKIASLAADRKSGVVHLE